MIVFLKSDGSVAYRSDETINLGSNKANKLTVIAPFDPSSVMTVCITLPNGETLEPIFMANRGKATKVLEGYPIDGKNLSVWEKEIESRITGISGTLRIQLYINNDGANFTSTLITIEVNVGVKNIPTPPPTEGAIYAQIIEYLSDSMNYVEGGKQEAEAAANEAEKWATGSYVDENGETQDVTSKDPQFNNNAKYYANSANEYAIASLNSANQSKDYYKELKNVVFDPLEKKVDNIEYIIKQFGIVKEQIDKEIAYTKFIPKDSDLYFYLNSFASGMTYKNLIDFSSFGNTSDGAVTIAKTDEGLVLNGTGNDSSIYISLIYPIREWGGKFFVTVKDPLPEGVELGVWIGPLGMDHIEYPIPQGGTEGSFDGYGNISIELRITGTMNNVLISPCLSFGKPMKYGDPKISAAVTEITDEISLWNGEDYELGSLESNGVNKDQTPYVRTDFIELPSGTDIVSIVKSAKDVTTDIRVYFYGAEKNYLGDSSDDDREEIDITSTGIAYNPSTDKYIRLRLKRTSSKAFEKTLRLETFGTVIWDGTVTLGGISTSSGSDSTTTCGLRTDYIPVSGGMTYNFTHNDYSKNISIYTFNSSKNYISKITYNKSGKFTLSSSVAYIRILLSSALDYTDGQITVNKHETFSISTSKFENLEGYGLGLDGIAYNKVNLEYGVYEQHIDSDGEVMDEPIITDIKDKIKDVFGDLNPLIKVTGNRAITLENDNYLPVPSVITYNIIQEG